MNKNQWNSISSFYIIYPTSSVGKIKKYLFTCANRQCKCLTEKLGLYFFTTSRGKALKHSKENDSPIWISEHPIEEIEGMYDTIRKMEGKND